MRIRSGRRPRLPNRLPNLDNKGWAISGFELFFREVMRILAAQKSPWIYPQAYLDAVTAVHDFIEDITNVNDNFRDRYTAAKEKALNLLRPYGYKYFFWAGTGWSYMMAMLRQHIEEFTRGLIYILPPP